MKIYELYDNAGRINHYIKYYNPHKGSGCIKVNANSLKHAYFLAYNNRFAKDNKSIGIIKRYRVNYDGLNDYNY